jgi:hypothetical protein
VVAVGVVVVELVVAASQVRPLAHVGWVNYKRPDRLVRDADLDPLASFQPTEAEADARRTIPPGATYAIVVGQDPPGADAELVTDVLRFWLVPRHYTTDLAAAQWVIAYHHASETLGVPYTQEIGLGPNANVVKVKR